MPTLRSLIRPLAALPLVLAGFLLALAPARPAVAAACQIRALARDGQVVPGGGTLQGNSFFLTSPQLNNGSQISFSARVAGSTKNQGVFVADVAGLHVIARGCGGEGGAGDAPTSCGDPTPLGGTFGGFFRGSGFEPDLDDAGNVLFLAEVDGGTASRALFLYRAATPAIVKVAAVGDVSPLGGVFTSVGSGVLAPGGAVLFLALSTGGDEASLFRWSNGSVTKVVAVGDAAPGGGTYEFVAGESLTFVDGTTIPTGPMPSVNAQGQVAFRARLNGGHGGIVVITNGVPAWHLRLGDPTPLGGTFFDVAAPILNANGELAFFADFQRTSGDFSSAWFAGATGHLRKVVEFFDPVAGGQVLGLAFSRGPMRPFDNLGDVITWVAIEETGGNKRDVLLLSQAGQPLRIVAAEGDETPLGGSFTRLGGWPTLNQMGKAAFVGFESGGPFQSGYYLASLCATPVFADGFESGDFSHWGVVVGN